MAELQVDQAPPESPQFGKYNAAALRYAHQVVGGEIPSCKWVKAACQRQLDDLARAESDPHFPFEWRPDKAEHVCRFIELLPHVKAEWAGRRLMLEPWQIFILTTVFGWYRKTGYRRFRTVYIEVPRKNAKSTLSSGVALYMLTADGEQGAEAYSAATTREQARIVFNDAQAMATREPEFRRRFGVRVNAHSLAVPGTASKFHSLAAEGSTLDGLNVHFACVDELHAHKTRAVWDVLETGMGARAQPILWAITTAGFDRSGICYEQRTYVTSVLNAILRAHDGMGYPVKGSIAEDDTYFGIIYTIDDEDDWADPACWAKANPNYGVSVYPDDIKRLADKAIKVASARSNFLTKRLNVWVNAATAWMDMRKWDACADPQLDIEDFRGEDCVAGYDLAAKVDIAAQAKVFLREGRYYVFMRFYLPQARVESEENAQYAGWAEEGWITATPGATIDFEAIKADLREDAARFHMLEVPCDPWQASQFMSEMGEEGEGLPMVEFRQTVQNMSEPMKELEAAVLDGRLVHDGNPVLTWMMANVIAKRDAKDNIFPCKEKEVNKIDGAVALIIALARAMAADNSADPTEVYVV
jgi:phage terminase large subunit-like protein